MAAMAGIMVAGAAVGAARWRSASASSRWARSSPIPRTNDRDRDDRYGDRDDYYGDRDRDAYYDHGAPRGDDGYRGDDTGHGRAPNNQSNNTPPPQGDSGYDD